MSWCRGEAATSLADLRRQGSLRLLARLGHGRLYLKVYAAEADNTYEELRVEPAP